MKSKQKQIAFTLKKLDDSIVIAIMCLDVKLQYLGKSSQLFAPAVVSELSTHVLILNCRLCLGSR